MKRIILATIALFMIAGAVNAQNVTISSNGELSIVEQNSTLDDSKCDKLTLKNNQTIKGTIIELIPEQYVKIKLEDGSIQTFPMDQVEKLYKESRYIYLKDTPTRRGLSKEERGTTILKNAIVEKPRYKGFIDFGYTVRTGAYGRDRIEFATTHGVQINSYIFVGAGVGLNLYHTDKNLVSIPIYAAARATLPYGKVMPYLDFKIGGTVNQVKGLYLSPTVGCRFAFGNNARSAFYAGIGYTAQMAQYTLFNPIRKEWFNDTKNCSGFTIKIGFDF